MSKIPNIAKSPLLKDSEWVEKLNLIAKSQTVDELSLRRIELDIKLVLSKSNDILVRAVCHQCLGTVASIRGNSKDLIVEYQKALALVVDRGLQMNYAIDLRRANSFRELRVISNKLFNDYPDDPKILREAMRSFSVLGDFISIDAIHQRLLALNKFDFDSTEINTEFVKNFTEKALRRGISSKQISNLFNTALKVIEDQGFSPIGTGFCLDTDDWSSSFRFVIESTPKQRAVLSSNIAKAIVSEYEDDLSDLITFGVMAPRGSTADAFKS